MLLVVSIQFACPASLDVPRSHDFQCCGRVDTRLSCENVNGVSNGGSDHDSSGGNDATSSGRSDAVSSGLIYHVSIW